MATDTQFRSF